MNKYFNSKVKYLYVIILFISFHVNKLTAQCTGCTTNMTTSVSSYTAVSGQTLCLASGITYTGSIVLNGGTICNSGTITNVTFLGGTFINYGSYTGGNVTMSTNANLTIHNYHASRFSMGTFVFVGSAGRPFNFYVYKGASATFTSSITQSAGIMNIEVGKTNPVSNPVSTSTLTVSSLFTVRRDNFSMLINESASATIGDILSLEGTGVKSVTNYGTLTLNRDLNIISAGSSGSTVTVTNYNVAVMRGLSASYTAGKVFVNNLDAGNMTVQTSLTLSKNTNTLTNTGIMTITQNLNVQAGLAVNSGTVTNNIFSASGGTVTNNNYLKSLANFSLTTTTVTVNNNGLLDIGGSLSNYGTINLASKSYVNTYDYYNDDNARINGPASIPDSSSYAKLFMKNSSQNNGFVTGKVLGLSPTLTGNAGNNGYGFNNVVNGSTKIASSVAFASKSAGVGNPLVINCFFMQQFYLLTGSASPTVICGSGSSNLTSLFNQWITFPFFTSTITVLIPVGIASSSYSWNPGNLVGQNQTVSPSVSTTYTCAVNYLGCSFTKTVVVNVFPASVTIIANQSAPLCFPSAGLTLSTTIPYIGTLTYQWYLNAVAISGANSNIWTPIQTGIYKLEVSNGVCSNVSSNSIILYPKPTVTITSSALGICQGNPVNFTATVGSGSGSGFSYQWTQNSSNVGTNSNLYSTLLAGSYAVNVTNSNGCVGTSNAINIQISANFSVNAGSDQIYGSTPVPIGGNPACATGGVSPYTYLWSTSTGFVGGSTNQCNNNVAPSANTIYTLTVTDAAGCQLTDNVMVIKQAGVISYIVPKKEIDGGYQLPVANKVYFKFEEEYKSSTLSYKIFEYNNVANSAPVTPVCALTPPAKILGDNRYYIDITTCSLLATKFYLVEVTNDKNEKFFFKFLN